MHYLFGSPSLMESAEETWLFEVERRGWGPEEFYLKEPSFVLGQNFKIKEVNFICCEKSIFLTNRDDSSSLMFCTKILKFLKL